MFGTSLYDKEKHTFIGGEIGQYIARLAKESGRDLVVIRYEELGVFCIIEFMSPNRDVFVDVKNLGGSLANFDRSSAGELGRRLFKPITCGETCQFTTENESRYLHDRQNDNSAEWERQERIERGE